MLVIGLTGSIGMGKSTAAARFRTHGVPVFDADAEVHRLYAGAAIAPIEAAFPGTTKVSGVDRQLLSAALLADPSGFARLEAIVHPMVKASERAFLHAAKAAGHAMAVLEIPLLFETGGNHKCDCTVLVTAPEHIQATRVLARPGMTEEKFARIRVQQLQEGEKIRRADFVVDTSASIPETEAQIDRILNWLRGREAQAFDRHWV